MSANPWSGLHRKFVTTVMKRGTRRGAPSPLEVQISGGELIVGGQRIVEPKIGRSVITWSQQTAGGFSSGSLELQYGGLMFRGSIWEGADPATAVRHLVQGISAEATRYTTRVGTEKAPAPPTADGLGIALELTPDTKGLPLLRLYFSDGKDDEDVTSAGGVVMEPAGNTLHVKFHFREQLARAGHRKFGDPFPVSGEFVVDYTGTSFAGTMHRFDANANGHESADEFSWTGHAVLTGSETPEALGAGTLSTEAPGAPSLAELTSLAPRRIGKYAFDLIIENMTWAIDDDWRSDFLKLQKPSLDDARQALLQPATGFYTGTLAPAYLGSMMRNVSDPTILHRPFGDAEKRRLDYFWSDGLGKNVDMNQQMFAMTPEAATRAEPRLIAYIDDTTKPWAKEAFEDFTDPERFAQTLNAIEDGSVEEVQRQTELLHILAPKEDYHVRFQQKLLAGLMARLTLQADPAASDHYEPWFEEAIKALLEKRVQADPELKKVLDELNTMVTDVGSPAAAAKLFIDAFVSAQGDDVFERAGWAQKKFVKDNPKWALAGKAMLIIAWVAMGVAALIGFMNWSTLPPDKQAGVVIGFAGIVIDVANTTHELFTADEYGLDVMDMADDQLLLSSDALEFVFRALNPGYIETLSTTLTEAIDDPLAALSKLFTTANVLRGLGVLAATALAVWTAYEFFSQVASTGTLTATILGKISLALNMLGAWSVVPTLILDIPVLNIVAAALVIFGVIFSIIVQIINSIETPADDLMDHVLRPFVNTLPDPPAGWQPKSA